MEEGRGHCPSKAKKEIYLTCFTITLRRGRSRKLRKCLEALPIFSLCPRMYCARAREGMAREG